MPTSTLPKIFCGSPSIPENFRGAANRTAKVAGNRENGPQGREARSFITESSHCIGVTIAPATFARPWFPVPTSTLQKGFADRPQEISQKIEDRGQRVSIPSKLLPGKTMDFIVDAVNRWFRAGVGKTS